MKQLLLTLLLLLNLNANHINWYGSYSKAHKKALQEDKPLMVLLIKKDSKRSLKMFKEIFMNQPYIDKINENYISVIVTYKQKESFPIEMLYTDIFPSLFLLDKYELFISEPLRGDITKEMMENLQ